MSMNITKPAKEYVEIGLKKVYLKKLDDGAVLTQIEEHYNIPETILLKTTAQHYILLKT